MSPKNSLKVKVGFVPAHKEPFDKEWAIQMRKNLRGSWSWVKVLNLDSLYRTLVEEGFIHHASMIHGDYTRPITEACEFLGIEPIVV